MTGADKGRVSCAALAIVAAYAAGMGTAAALPQRESTTARAADPAAVEPLAGTLRGVIAGQPAEATIDTIQASLAFAISQAQQPCPVTLGAIDRALAGSQPRKVRIALEALRGTACRMGTGGLGGSGGAPGAAAALGAGPAGGGGGAGGSSYTNP